MGTDSTRQQPSRCLVGASAMNVMWILETLLLAYVATHAVEAQGATCANTRCQNGYQCVLVEPENCVGCPNVPRCVQQECNTGCYLPCGFYQRCVLVATGCCPVATCRSPTTTTTTVRYPTITTTTPRYPTYTTTPRYTTTTTRYTLFPPFTFPQFTLPPFFTFRPG